MSHAPKHVALFARSLSGGGGVERVVVQLAGALSARGHRVDLVLARAKGRFLSELDDAVRVVDLRAPPAVCALPTLLRRPRTALALAPPMIHPGVAQVIGAIPRLSRYLRRERPDTLLAALDYANVCAIVARELAGSFTRVIVSVHNHMSSASAKPDRPHLSHIVALTRRYYRGADAVVCVSKGVADDLKRQTKLPSAQVLTIYNPVVHARIATLAQALPPHPWLEDASVPVVLGAGKLRPQKDFHTLIRAFAQLRQRRRARLIILGEGPQRDALETLIRDLNLSDDVSLPGFQPNPYAYMARAAAFVLSSAWEGFGNVLVEAMACACPVLSTDCPSGPAEILAHGRYGRLVPVGDHEALSVAMRDTLDSPGDVDAASVRAREFTVERSTDCYEKILFPNP